MMMYDLHTIETGYYLYHHASLNANSLDNPGNATRNVAWVTEYLLSQGVPAKKIILGIPTYGRTLMMEDQTKNAIYDPAIDRGPPGPYTQEAGYLAYYELCERLMDGTSYSVVQDLELGVPYAYETAGSTWISYDDAASARIKAQYAVSKGLGGSMVWAVNDDDFRNICNGISPFPLLSTIRAVFAISPTLP